VVTYSHPIIASGERRY